MRRMIYLLLPVIFLVCLSACTPRKNFVGTWKTDLFDYGNTRELGDEMASGLLEDDFLGSFASMLVGELHWNATMEIKEDGTLIMNSGMEFYATWRQEGDKIIIEGDNIYGVATLSEDQKTLYFENSVNGKLDDPDGIVLGSNTITFEFKRIE